MPQPSTTFIVVSTKKIVLAGSDEHGANFLIDMLGKPLAN
jgi:hypothetical protein